MTEPRKQPSQPAQADQAQRQQFEQECAQLQHGPHTPAGAQAFPSGMTIFAAIAELLREGGIKDQLFELWKKLKGGTTEQPTPQPPAPPPEPAS
jgi:hypothetical protein